MRASLHLSVLIGIFTFFCSAQADSSNALFTKIFFKGYTNKPVLEKRTVRNRLDCSMACTGVSQCQSFSIQSTSQNCSLYGSRVTALDIMATSIPDQEETFYVRRSAAGGVGNGYTVLPGSGKQVRLISLTLNWTQAKDRCETEGGQLLIANDLNTLAEVGQRLAVPSTCWVGAVKHSSGKWLWLDGALLDSSLWHPGEPSGAAAICVQLWKSNGLLLLDNFGCSTAKSFICEL